MRIRFQMPPRAAFDGFRARSEKRLERAALSVSDRLAQQAKNDIRQEMLAAGLGRLNRIIDAGSDKRKGRIKRRGNGGFSASGWVHIRGQDSERSVGAIVSATEGADIFPKRGKWLWLPTDEIPKRVGRFKMTYARYLASGLDSRIGPLVRIPGRHPGEALLIVENVTVDRFDRPGRARRLPKRGGIGGSRRREKFIVAFVGIRRTTRTPDVNVQQFMRTAQRAAPGLVAAHLRRDSV